MAPKTLSNGESRATAGVFAEHPDVQVGITGICGWSFGATLAEQAAPETTKRKLFLARRQCRVGPRPIHGESAPA